METTKQSNPKDVVGAHKVPPHVVPCGVLLEIALGMLEGSCKYGAHNYRAVGVRASIYYDATMRHLMAWWEGEDNDPDSGLSHIIKAITTLVVLRDSMHADNWVDDRPPRLPGGADIAGSNAAAKSIIRQYPNSVPPYTEIKNVTH